VLLIVSDDHGWGDLPSNWTKTDVELPFLDRIGKEGYRFPGYHTAPLCGPARAGLLTGQYSMDCGMWRGPESSAIGESNYRGIKRDVRMLPEILQTAGYRTGLFGKWHLGEIEGERPNDRGFDEFYGFLRGAQRAQQRNPRQSSPHVVVDVPRDPSSFLLQRVTPAHPFQPGSHAAHDQYANGAGQRGTSQKSRCPQEPPRLPRIGHDPDGECRPFPIPATPFTPGRHLETVRARRQFCVARAPLATDLDPVRVQADETVPEPDMFRRREMRRRVADFEALLAGLKG